VLTGGTSALYGADAVTGVVNFILKQDFESFAFEGQIGNAIDGDLTGQYISACYLTSLNALSLNVFQHQ